MASVWFRYKSGDEDEWQLNDNIPDLRELVQLLHRTLAAPAIASFALAPEEGASSADYGFAAVRMSEVVAWRIYGLVDVATEASLWSELRDLSISD